MIKIYIRQIGLGAILVGAALMSVLLHGEVDAEDRDMMEMMELVVLSQKFEECRKNKDVKKRLGCFDNLTEKIKVQMKIFQHALDFKVPKANWYGLQTEPATAKKKETQGKHKWGKEFSIDVEKVMEKIEQYLE